MFAGFGGGSSIYTGDIGHSLRLRSAASAYLSRTFGTGSAATKQWVSLWIKRGAIGTSQMLWGAADASTRYDQMYFAADDRLYIDHNSSSSLFGQLVTARVFRDPTAWIHIFYQHDSTDATAANRMRLWINGVEETSFSSRINIAVQNSTLASWMTSTTDAHNIGRNPRTAINLCDLYIARFAAGQGTSPGVSSFGYFNTEINEWVSKTQSQVKAVVDAGGTNSFMLDFDNGASLTTLGYDKSSKGNNWTLNNVSLTAGSTYDWMLDVPGNSFPTYNAIEYAVNTFSNANLRCTTSAGGSYTSGTTMLMDAALNWWAEVTVTTNSFSQIGVVKEGFSGLTQLASQVNGYSYYHSGLKYNNGTSAAYGASYTTGDVIGIHLSGGSLTFYKQTGGTGSFVSQGVAYTGLSGNFTFAVSDGSTGAAVLDLNCGQQPFNNTSLPSGAKALCQANLPDVPTALLNPEKHFDVATRAGDSNSSQTLSGLLFPPGLVWTKDRNTGYQHSLQDIVRGVGANGKLYSSLTEAEGGANSVYGHVSAFNSDGVTFTNGSGGGQHVKANGVTYVDWLFKAGGAAVTNNAGSISSQVSANRDLGFSIVTFTGTGATSSGVTIGHGLEKKPSLIITKKRSGGTDYGWSCWHKDLGGNYGIWLDKTNARNPGMWGGHTNINTSVFSPPDLSYGNEAGALYVAYCFTDSDIIKCGSYTGNGSADGTNVNLGFKPKFIMYKRSDAVANWVIWDGVRSPDNVVNDYLLPNSSAAEAVLDTLDITSQGFKLRTSNADNNAGTIIYIAIADVVGKYSLAR